MTDNAAVAQMAEHRFCKPTVVGSTPTRSTITGHQPVYAPWLGFFHKLSMADHFVIFDGVQFERHGYSNRVKIKTHHGAQWLTVPVEHGKPFLRDAKIVEDGWRRKHIRTIELAYKKASYFDEYFGAMENLLCVPWRWLADLDECLFYALFGMLGMNMSVSHATNIMRLEGGKSDLVLDMCRKLGATEYIFGAKGRDYANVPAFEREGIKVRFQDYRHPVYPQLHGGFIPGLSVIDLLFNCGPRSFQILTGGQE